MPKDQADQIYGDVHSGQLDKLSIDEIKRIVKIDNNAINMQDVYENAKTTNVVVDNMPNELFTWLVYKGYLFPAVSNWKSFTRFCKNEQFQVRHKGGMSGGFHYEAKQLCTVIGCPYRHCSSFNLEEPELRNGSELPIKLSMANFGSYKNAMSRIHEETCKRYMELLHMADEGNGKYPEQMDIKDYEFAFKDIDNSLNTLNEDIIKFVDAHQKVFNIENIHENEYLPILKGQSWGLQSYLLNLNEVYISVMKIRYARLMLLQTE